MTARRNPPMPAEQMRAARVVAFCPACGGQSIVVGEGGHLTCTRLDCANPTAVDELLADRETEHVVVFKVDGYTVRHPLRERVGDALLECQLDGIAATLGRAVAPGRYRATPNAVGGWSWASLKPAVGAGL